MKVKNLIFVSVMLACMVLGLSAQNGQMSNVQGISNRSNAPVFGSPCGAVSVTTEDFEQVTVVSGGSAIPDCWKKISTDGGYPKVLNTNMPYGVTSKAIAFKNSKPQYFISPQIDAPLASKIVRFKLNMAEANGGIIQVGYMTDPTDATTFVAVSDYRNSEARQYVSYETIFVGIANTSPNLYIAFRYGDVGGTTQNTSNIYYIDDITISDVPSCLPVTNIQVANILATSADVSFSSLGTATAWEYVISSNANTNIDNETAIAISNTNFNTSSLNPNTEYNLWIRANCGNNDYSSWAKVSFRTLCGEVTRDLSENFESTNADKLPYCWTRVSQYSTFSDTYPFVKPNIGYNSTNGLYFYLWGQTNNSLIMATPKFNDNLNELQMGIWLKAQRNYTYKFIVGVMSDVSNQNTFVALDTVVFSHENWDYYEFSLANAPATHKYVALMLKNENATGSATVYADNITFSPISLCPKPNNISAVAIKSDSVRIAFNAPEGTTTWQYVVAPVSDNINLDAITPTDITNDTVWIENLTPNTSYSVWVRSNCGNSGYSEWSMQPLVFTTVCPNEVAAGWTETFSTRNAEDNNRPYCWKIPYGYSNNINAVSYPHVSLQQGYVADGSMVFKSSGTNFISNIAVTPKFRAVDTLKNQTLSVMLKRVDINVSSSFEVGVMSSPTDVSSFVLIQDITPNNNGWNMKEVSLAAAPTTHHYIAFRMTNLTPGTATNVPEYFLDDVTVYTTTNCLRPTDLEAMPGVQSSSSAVLSWNARNNETVWHLEYKELSANSWTAVNNVTSNLYTLNNLTANTVYEARVKALCHGSTQSVWSYPVRFRTSCDSQSLPFAEDFSGTSSEIFPPNDCWQKYRTSVDDVFNGNRFVNGGDWSYGNSVEGINSAKAVINLRGENMSDWLVTPKLTLTESSMLTFDIAYTIYGSNNQADQSGTDDKFMVLIGTDDGTNWSAANATVWSNDNTTPHSLNSITPTPQQITIDLSAYRGTIKIAFYAESSVSNADNNLHIDNINVKVIPVTEPKVTTLPATDITTTSATLNMSIEEGSYPVTESGYYYRAHSDQRWHNTLNANISNLTAATDYEFYAYIVANNIKHNGDTLTFRTDNTVKADIANSQIAVYPNPASDIVRVSTDNVTENATVTIVDIFGRKMGQYVVVKGDNSIYIDVTSFAEGVYMIHIVSSSSNTTGCLVVKRY